MRICTLASSAMRRCRYPTMRRSPGFPPGAFVPDPHELPDDDRHAWHDKRTRLRFSRISIARCADLVRYSASAWGPLSCSFHPITGARARGRPPCRRDLRPLRCRLCAEPAAAGLVTGVAVPLIRHARITGRPRWGMIAAGAGSPGHSPGNSPAPTLMTSCTASTPTKRPSSRAWQHESHPRRTYGRDH